MLNGKSIAAGTHMWKSAGLSRKQSFGMRRGKKFNLFRQRALQSVRQVGGKCRGQKIDIELQVAIRIVTKNGEISAMARARANQFQGNTPHIADLGRDQHAALSPAQFPSGVNPL